MSLLPRLLSCSVAVSLLIGPAANASPRAHRTSHPLRSEAAATPLAAGNITYQGGPIITHVEVVVVLWGPSVASIVTDNIANFYTAVTNSPLMDWMGEYDTVGQHNGTNQHVYHGKYLQTVTIMPAMTTGTITDSDIQNELTKNIQSGTLPTPQADPVEGHVNTLYAVYFPPNLKIDDGSGSLSCTKWCAYHGSFSYTGLSTGVPYSVIPDFSNSACSQGCGGNSPTEGMTCTSAHELLEAVSEADNNLTSWYDSANGEICDICNNCEMVAGFSVQQCWSQRLGQCIAQDPNLPLCNGTKRPCRSCTAADCTGATPVCITDPLAANAGECAATAGDGGTSSSGGSSGSTSGSTSGGSSGSTSGGSSSGSSGSSSGASSSSGSTSSSGAVNGSTSGSTSGGGSSGTSSGGIGSSSGTGSGSGSGSSDDGGVGNGALGGSQGGCACTSGPGGGPVGAAAGLGGLLFAATAAVRRSRRASGSRRR